MLDPHSREKSGPGRENGYRFSEGCPGFGLG